MTEVGLRIRVSADLREQFMQVCRLQDSTASQELRKFMRRYIDEHARSGPQLDLLATPDLSGTNRDQQ